jgi:arylsulfatase A-like enzyme
MLLRRCFINSLPHYLQLVCGCMQVVFDGEFPLEGAKVVETAMRRTVNRVMRQAQAQPGCKARHGCTVKLALHGHDDLRALVSNNTAPGVQQKHKPNQQQQQQQPKQQQLARQHQARQSPSEEL